MIQLRKLRRLLLSVCACMVIAGTAQADREIVSSFELSITGVPMPSPAAPYQVDLVGTEIFGFGAVGNFASFTGGAYVWAGAPDFYRDGFFEWAFHEVVDFGLSVNHVDFSFWALRGPDSLSLPTANGPDAMVSVAALNAMGDVVDTTLPVAISFDFAWITDDESVRLDGPGIVKLVFSFDGDPPLGYGIDGLYATTEGAAVTGSRGALDDSCLLTSIRFTPPIVGKEFAAVCWAGIL
ncbi:MAG: hypothetical protein ACI9BW_003067 [Gammaproteobacteria bacterium]|jgi:hypothetical protein